MAAFKLSFSIQKKFKEKKFSGEIVFALIKDIIYGTLYIFVFISFFMNKYKSLQGGQLPWDNLPFLQICWILLSQKIWSKKFMTT